MRALPGFHLFSASSRVNIFTFKIRIKGRLLPCTKDDDSLLAPCCRKAISWRYDVQVFNEERRSEDFFIDL